MNYLLIGGEFNNKGAEAMTLVAMYNIISNDPNPVIYIWDRHTHNPFNFGSNIIMLDCSEALLTIQSGNRLPVKQAIKEAIKIVLPGKRSVYKEIFRIRKVLSKIDYTMDISGYQLSSKWPNSTSITYCNWIRTMKNFGSKVYLMPQSFGPFDYQDSHIIDTIKENLSKCDRIFAREAKGYADLRALGLNNVEICNDSVLIDGSYSPTSVIPNFDYYKEEFNISAKKNIAIIPNYRLIDKGGCDLSKIIDFYCSVIEKKSDYDFYLIAHAGEDMTLCKTIKNRFLVNDRVHLIDHVLLSFNYEQLASKMNFIIASRYHSIVHAYRQGTPAVILGWAEKYREVAKLFEQEKYIIDLDSPSEPSDIILSMCSNCASERDTIRKKLFKVQSVNCYSFLENRSVKG